MGQPCSGVFFPRMSLHVTDNGLFALNIAVPCPDSIINVILRERTQHFMEARIGFLDNLPVQALTELRRIGIEAEQLHVARPQDSTTNRGIALDYSVLMVTVTAGITIWHILHNSGQYKWLVLLMQFPNRRGCGCFGIPEYSGPVCAKLRFLGIDVLLRLMVDGGHGIFLPLLAALWDSGNGHIMLIPQLFHNLLQPVCRKAAHFHIATSGNGTESEIEVQFGSRSFGVLAV